MLTTVKYLYRQIVYRYIQLHCLLFMSCEWNQSATEFYFEQFGNLEIVECCLLKQCSLCMKILQSISTE